MIHEFDVVIVGGGIAGLTAALTASETCNIAVISKVYASRSHSGSAQGGSRRLLETRRKTAGNGTCSTR